MKENKISVECILSEKEHKEAQRIGESIVGYITRQNTSYAIAEKSLDVALDRINRHLILSEKK